MLDEKLLDTINLYVPGQQRITCDFINSKNEKGSVKMNQYLELKKKRQDEVNAFPMVFAFNNKQFEEAMQKLGLTVNDTDKIYKLPGGGFIRRTDSAKLKEMFDRHEKEMETAIKSDTTGEGFVYEMFSYELSNHEYCITGDVEPTLDALGLTIEKVNASAPLLHGLNKAIKAQYANE
jgi:hypothetical protein